MQNLGVERGFSPLFSSEVSSKETSAPPELRGAGRGKGVAVERVAPFSEAVTHALWFLPT